jgi:L-alanine-DL-glutamate epimerase-like enolase superfamily enzyme
MMEYPVTASPLRNELVMGIPAMEDGEVVVGDEPGLGIDLDPDTIARYRV